MYCSTYAKPFPDHWEKKAIATKIRTRRLFPGVLNRVSQPICFETWLSFSMAFLISRNSYSTRGSVLAIKFIIWGMPQHVSMDALVALCMIISQRLECLFLPGWCCQTISTSLIVIKTCRPLLTSHRGDSGTNHIIKTWITDGNPWIAEAILQDQLFGMWNVPNVCAWKSEMK